jgi:hypothetical protein
MRVNELREGGMVALSDRIAAGYSFLEALLEDAGAESREPEGAGRLSPTIYIPLRRGERLPMDVVARRV